MIFNGPSLAGNSSLVHPAMIVFSATATVNYDCISTYIKNIIINIRLLYDSQQINQLYNVSLLSWNCTGAVVLGSCCFVAIFKGTTAGNRIKDLIPATLRLLVDFPPVVSHRTRHQNWLLSARRLERLGVLQLQLSVSQTELKRFP